MTNAGFVIQGSVNSIALSNLVGQLHVAPVLVPSFEQGNLTNTKTFIINTLPNCLKLPPAPGSRAAPVF